MTSYAAFARTVSAFGPSRVVILGSGLSRAAQEFVERAAIAFADVPGLVLPTVGGHGGRIAVGVWSCVPTLVYFGRLHFYEGHSWNTVTTTVRTAAELGVKRIILTNAAGGIHPALGPGALMAIRRHVKWLGPYSWRSAQAGEVGSQPYSQRLLDRMQEHESAAGQVLVSGTYAALTGPCYETPAEIRALAACGADAVGMSTAMEAEEAARLGLEVAAISCITNKAAGIGGATLNHAEVLANANLGVDRMRELLGALLSERGV
jgi:purine-nucleoside phosphorylase